MCSTTENIIMCTLTVHVHQDADVGVAHSVEHLTGHGLSEEGVIGRGDKHALPRPLQQHAAFSPSDGGQACQVGLFISFFFFFSIMISIIVSILSIKAIKLTL